MEHKSPAPSSKKQGEVASAEVLCDHRPHSETYKNARKFRFLFHDVRDMVATTNTDDAGKIVALKRKLLTRVLGKSWTTPEESGRFANTYYPLGLEKRLLQQGILFLESNTYGLFKPCGLVAHAKYPWIAVATRGMLQLSNNDQARQVFHRSPGVEQHSVWFHLDAKKDDEIIDSDMERIKSVFAYEIQYTMLVTGTNVCVVVLVRRSNSRLVTVTADKGVFNNLTAMIAPFKTEWLEWKWSSKGDASSKDRCIDTLLKDDSVRGVASEAHKWLTDSDNNLKQVKPVSIDYNPRAEEQVVASMSGNAAVPVSQPTASAVESKPTLGKVVEQADSKEKAQTEKDTKDGAKMDKQDKDKKKKKRDKKKKAKSGKRDSDLDTDSDASDKDDDDSDAERTRRKNKRKNKRDKSKSKKRTKDSDSEQEDDAGTKRRQDKVKSEAKDMDESDDQVKDKAPSAKEEKQPAVSDKSAKTKVDKHAGKKRRRADSDDDDDEKDDTGKGNTKPQDKSKVEQNIDITTKNDTDDDDENKSVKKRKHKKQKHKKKKHGSDSDSD